MRKIKIIQNCAKVVVEVEYLKNAKSSIMYLEGVCENIENIAKKFPSLFSYLSLEEVTSIQYTNSCAEDTYNNSINTAKVIFNKAMNCFVATLEGEYYGKITNLGYDSNTCCWQYDDTNEEICIDSDMCIDKFTKLLNSLVCNNYLLLTLPKSLQLDFPLSMIDHNKIMLKPSQEWGIDLDLKLNNGISDTGIIKEESEKWDSELLKEYRNPQDCYLDVPSKFSRTCATDAQQSALGALALLSQALQHTNEYWCPDWHSDSIKFCVVLDREAVPTVASCSVSPTFLVFETENICQNFIDTNEDLIVKAAPFLAGIQSKQSIK